MEWPEGRCGRVPAGDQPDGSVHAGGLQIYPQGIIAAESGLTPAQPLLEHRQARFAHRLYARPQGGGGPEEILTREGAAVNTRLQAAAGIRRGETVEPQQ